MGNDFLKFNLLKKGDTIGVFTPSSPSYRVNEGLYLNGIKNLRSLGFNVQEGALSSRRASQGYRSAGPKERAQEFMELIQDPNVHGLISTIGGSNSSSLIPYLDFDAIRKSRKLICGFSDVTSIHLAVLKHAKLQTLYGPSVMCWFGDWPDGIPQSTEWFLAAAVVGGREEREIHPPKSWSNHSRKWDNGDWKNLPRQWQANSGWQVLGEGSVEAPILAVNFNTLMSAAGTPYWPDLSGKILLLEDMAAPQSRSERNLRHLSFTGALDQIAGLIIGKPEFYDQEGAPFGYEDLICEVIDQRRYPIISNFDCSHTVPMLSVPQLSRVRLEAGPQSKVRFTFLPE